MKSLVQNLALASFYFSFSSAFAAPPVAPFYESVIQMSPTGILGQVIKKELFFDHLAQYSGRAHLYD